MDGMLEGFSWGHLRISWIAHQEKETFFSFHLPKFQSRTISKTNKHQGSSEGKNLTLKMPQMNFLNPKVK